MCNVQLWICVITAYGTKIEWFHCVQLASQHLLEKEILILADRNIHISSSMKTLSTGSNTETLWKNKKQMSRILLLLLTTKCDRLWRNRLPVPGYVKFWPVISGGSLIRISPLSLSAQRPAWPAGLMMNSGTDGFCCHLEWWLQAVSLSLNQGGQTDRHTNRMADLYIVVGWWWPFPKWQMMFWYVPICFSVVVWWCSHGAFSQFDSNPNYINNINLVFHRYRGVTVAVFGANGCLR